VTGSSFNSYPLGSRDAGKWQFGNVLRDAWNAYAVIRIQDISFDGGGYRYLGVEFERIMARAIGHGDEIKAKLP
jgi:hypothetical protein